MIPGVQPGNHSAHWWHGGAVAAVHKQRPYNIIASGDLDAELFIASTIDIKKRNRVWRARRLCHPKRNPRKYIVNVY